MIETRIFSWMAARIDVLVGKGLVTLMRVLKRIEKGVEERGRKEPQFLCQINQDI